MNEEKELTLGQRLVREWQGVPLEEYQRDIELESHFNLSRLDHLESLIRNRVSVFFPELGLIGYTDYLMLMLRNQVLKRFLDSKEDDFYDFVVTQINLLFPIEESIAPIVLEAISTENSEVYEILKSKEVFYWDYFIQLLNEKGMNMMASSEVMQQEVKALIKVLRQRKVQDEADYDAADDVGKERLEKLRAG